MGPGPFPPPGLPPAAIPPATFQAAPATRPTPPTPADRAKTRGPHPFPQPGPGLPPAASQAAASQAAPATRPTPPTAADPAPSVGPVRSILPVPGPPPAGADDEYERLPGTPRDHRDRRRPRGLTALAAAAIVVVGTLASLLIFSNGADDDVAPTSGPEIPQPTGQPTQPPPSQPAAVAGGTPEGTLQSLINTTALRNCQPKSPIDSKWADAELTCTGTDGVPVSAYHFAGQSEIDRQIGALAAHFTDTGNCDDGQPSVETWTTPQEPAGGTKLCYYYAGNFVIYWFYGEDRVAFAAQDPSPPRLTGWWHSFDPMKR